MTTNSQLSTTKHKKKQKQKKTKETRTGTESWKWRSHGGLSAGRGRGRMGENEQGKRSINGIQNRQGEVKKSMGNVEAKELICTPTHGHEPSGGCGWERGCRMEGNKVGKNGTTVIA